MSGPSRYEPPSDFLRAVIAEEVPFSPGQFGDQNLARLIEFTRDCDDANRDWAVMLLSQLELNRPDVRSALLAASDDPNPEVRSEAILGLVALDRAKALALTKREFAGPTVLLPVFEAAELLAHPSLVEDLQCFQEPSGCQYMDDVAKRALDACTAGKDDI